MPVLPTAVYQLFSNLNGQSSTVYWDLLRFPSSVEKTGWCVCCRYRFARTHLHHDAGRADDSKAMEMCPECHVQCGHGGHTRGDLLLSRQMASENRDACVEELATRWTIQSAWPCFELACHLALGVIHGTPVCGCRRASGRILIEFFHRATLSQPELI